MIAPDRCKDSAAVQKRAAAGERLVCLEFPVGLGWLYCHSYVLSASSSFFRNVLGDTQQQQRELCSIPLTDESNVAVWEVALRLMYGEDPAKHTNLENAQALLLLAHEYDMVHIQGGCRHSAYIYPHGALKVRERRPVRQMPAVVRIPYSQLAIPDVIHPYSRWCTPHWGHARHHSVHLMKPAQ